MSTVRRPLMRCLAAAAAASALLATLGCAEIQAGKDRARMKQAERDATAALSPLILARGVSGREGPVAEVVIAALRDIEPRWQPRVDDAGNVWLSFAAAHGPEEMRSDVPPAPPAAPILFIAHMDEIGLSVTSIRADGLLECATRGGLFDHLYRGTAIELVTSGGAVLPGISLPLPAGVAPPAPGAVPAVPFVLDVGAPDFAHAEAMGIAIGDTATVPKELRRLGAHRIAGRSNDDRVGCAALLLALEELHADGDLDDLHRPVSFVWSTREEVGLEGADVVARTMRPVPGTVYAIDTFVTSDSPLEDDHYAFARLGDGPVLRALDNSSVTPPQALAIVRGVARRNDVPLQMGTMGGGNDGSRFVPEGAIDCPLAWPQRNSHSRVETLDLRDLVGLSRLVAALARRE